MFVIHQIETSKIFKCIQLFIYNSRMTHDLESLYHHLFRLENKIYTFVNLCTLLTSVDIDTLLLLYPIVWPSLSPLHSPNRPVAPLCNDCYDTKASFGLTTLPSRSQLRNCIPTQTKHVPSRCSCYTDLVTSEVPPSSSTRVSPSSTSTLLSPSNPSWFLYRGSSNPK